MTTRTKDTATIQALLWRLEDSMMQAALRYELKGSGLDLAERVRQLANAARDIRLTYNDRHGL